MVIGGGQIYDQIRPKATRIYLTRVDMDVEGDTFFRDPDPSRWAEVKRKEMKAGPQDSADFTFITLDRTRPAPSATPPEEA